MHSRDFKNYLKYKNKYLKVKRKLQYGSGIEEIKTNLESDIKILLNNEQIDHNIIIKEIDYEGNNILLVSLNIAQQDSMKTVSKYSRIQVYLRSEANLRKKDKYDKQKENIFRILSESLYNNGQLKEEYCNLFNDNNEFISLFKLKKLCKEVSSQMSSIGINDINDIFLKKFEINPEYVHQYFPQGIALDLVFRSESNTDYKIRIKRILIVLFDRLKDYASSSTKHVILCLQEISPIDLFIEVFDELKNDYEMFKMTHLEGDFGSEPDTNSVLIHSVNNINVKIMDREKDKILNGDDSLLSKLSYDKGPRQNNLYSISFSNKPKKSINIYNVHTAYYADKKATSCMDYINTKLKSSGYSIIVGDMNLKLSCEDKDNHINKFTKDKLCLDLIITPEEYYPDDVQTNSTYDVYIHNLNK